MNGAQVTVDDGVVGAFWGGIADPAVIGEDDSGLVESMACVVLDQIIVATGAENVAATAEPSELGS